MADQKLNRRSFFARIAGGAVLATGAMSAITGAARAQVSNLTDRDSNDPGGRGRGTGVTDGDPTDQACTGRSG